MRSVLRRFASTEELSEEAAAAAAIRSWPRPSLLHAPLGGLEALGIETQADLLEHFPHSHSNRELVPAAQLAIGQEGTVAVTVRSVSVRPMRNRRQKRVEAKVFDESGPLVAVWFNRPWIARELTEGTHLLIHGKLRQRNQFWVKTYELLGNGNAPIHTLGRVPVHPATKGITPDRLRELISEARPLARAVVEPLPARLRVEEGLAERPAVLDAVHFPETEEDEQGARRRLAFEELFLLQLAVAGRASAAARAARRDRGPLALVAALRADGRPGARHR
jgi:ATP-dependent DNA helicase RecG